MVQAVHLNRSRWRWGVMVLGGCLLVLALQRWLPGFVGPSLATPLPQDPYIQVYFNQTQSHAYTDPYRRIQRYGDDLEQVIIEAIAQAQTSIDIAVQEFNLPQVAVALRDRAKTGVTVRIILENQYNRVWQPLNAFQSKPLDEYTQSKHSEQQRLIDRNHNGKITAQELAQGDAIRILEKAALPLMDDTADGSKGSGLMHHKFMIIDHKTLVVGSANWTLSDVHGDFSNADSRGNANAILKIDHPELAAIFADEFELMWGDGIDQQRDSLFGLQKPARSPHTISLPGSQITAQFSPASETQPWQHSTNGLIAKTLIQAQHSIDLALFVFSDQAIADTLAQKSQTGVKIQALIDRNFVYRSYSEALDMLGTAIPDHHCKYEANNHPWQKPIAAVGTPILPPGDKLHHKFALIDDQTVIIGSHNWSAAANHTNDENLLIIRNPTVAAHFRREFDRLIANADLGLTKTLQDKILSQRKQCKA